MKKRRGERRDEWRGKQKKRSGGTNRRGKERRGKGMGRRGGQRVWEWRIKRNKMINTHNSAASANLTFLLAEPFHLLVTVLPVVVCLGGPGSAQVKHTPAALPWGMHSLMEEERAGSSLSES